MDWQGWLSVAAIIASLVASGVTIWAHVRISQIKHIFRQTTAGQQSPNVNLDSGGGNQYITIVGGGGLPPINPSGNPSQLT